MFEDETPLGRLKRGRMLWLEEEQGFVYSDMGNDFLHPEIPGARVTMEMILCGISFGAFQRAVVKVLERARSAQAAERQRNDQRDSA